MEVSVPWLGTAPAAAVLHRLQVASRWSMAVPQPCDVGTCMFRKGIAMLSDQVAS